MIASSLIIATVLVDKPVAESVSQAQELGQLAGTKGLVLYAFQNRRWDSDFLTLRGLLSLPESHPSHLGTITEFESQSVVSVDHHVDHIY